MESERWRRESWWGDKKDCRERRWEGPEKDKRRGGIRGKAKGGNCYETKQSDAQERGDWERQKGTSEAQEIPSGRTTLKETPVVTRVESFPPHSSSAGMWSGRGCQQGLGKHRAPRLTQLGGLLPLSSVFVWTAICVNYEPAPSKTQQTSASWLAHKFTQRLNAHHPLCCL